MSDPVNQPEHYNSGKVEAIDAIQASMTPEEFQGYLKGNVLKYLWRYRYKGKPQEDLAKAQWYLGKLQDCCWEREKTVDVPTPFCPHNNMTARHSGGLTCDDCGETV